MKSTKSKIVTPKKQPLMSAVLALAGGLALQSVASADEDIATVECSLSTLRGVYMFHASGYDIVNGAAQPKAIIETLVFDGLGNVTTPAVSLSLNGTIIQPPEGAPAIYTVDADCTGTLTFGDGKMFDLQVRPNGKTINMLQTNPNSVLQGTVEKVARLSA